MPSADSMQCYQVVQRGHECWDIMRKAHSFHITRCDGLQIVRELVDHPGVSYPANELIKILSPPPPDFLKPAPLYVGDPSVTGFSHYVSGRGDDTRIDQQARMAYRKRLNDLKEELTEAEGLNDWGRQAKILREIGDLESELLKGAGFFGCKPQDKNRERARLCVFRSLKRAFSQLSKEKELHALSLHLKQAIRTGHACVYWPSPVDPIQVTFPT